MYKYNGPKFEWCYSFVLFRKKYTAKWSVFLGKNMQNGHISPPPLPPGLGMIRARPDNVFPLLLPDVRILLKYSVLR